MHLYDLQYHTLYFYQIDIEDIIDAYLTLFDLVTLAITLAAEIDILKKSPLIILVDLQSNPLTGNPSTKIKSFIIFFDASIIALCVDTNIFVLSISSLQIVPIPT